MNDHPNGCDKRTDTSQRIRELRDAIQGLRMSSVREGELLMAYRIRHGNRRIIGATQVDQNEPATSLADSLSSFPAFAPSRKLVTTVSLACSFAVLALYLTPALINEGSVELLIDESYVAADDFTVFDERAFRSRNFSVYEVDIPVVLIDPGVSAYSSPTIDAQLWVGDDGRILGIHYDGNEL